MWRYEVALHGNGSEDPRRPGVQWGQGAPGEAESWKAGRVRTEKAAGGQEAWPFCEHRFVPGQLTPDFYHLGQSLEPPREGTEGTPFLQMRKGRETNNITSRGMCMSLEQHVAGRQRNRSPGQVQSLLLGSPWGPGPSPSVGPGLSAPLRTQADFYEKDDGAWKTYTVGQAAGTMA